MADDQPRPHRPPFLAPAAAVLAVAATLTTFLPWGSSGERARSSHELVDIAVRAGVLPDGQDTLARLWYLVPALCGLVVIGVAAHRPRAAAAAAATLGALVVTGSVLVSRSPLVLEPGAVAGGIVGAATALTGAAAALVPGPKGQADGNERSVGQPSDGR